MYKTSFQINAQLFRWRYLTQDVCVGCLMKASRLSWRPQMLTTSLIHHVRSLTFPSEAVGTCLPTCRSAEHNPCVRRALFRYCCIWDASAAELPSTVRAQRQKVQK